MSFYYLTSTYIIEVIDTISTTAVSSPLDPYAAAHLRPQGEGDARPTALQIIHDEGLVNKMTDKVMFITGASSGLGAETARALHATGAHIFMQVRDLKKGQEVLEEIRASSEGKGEIELLFMELDSRDLVREGASEFLKRTKKLNVLVCNAGIRNPPEGRTKDGFEIQWGTNHISHFIPFNLLLPTLLSSSTPSFNSHVIMVSSGAHRTSNIYFDNVNLEGIYDPKIGYAQSKTANILVANQIERLYGNKGVHGLSVHPGSIPSKTQRYDDPKQLKELKKLMKDILKNYAQVAATQVWAAVGNV
ncbi:hypothetical protein G7Y89_g15414 [Cudoniella acicularis]|uniref:NAD(P)-binding protein n=1 Tax=Cudoniella acicularis TaxID=354080 RepID=A0A8H4VLV3_9HELO|nr:hypothetical protein G7Y89_g15414 [Cudoniella acicularis]